MKISHSRSHATTVDDATCRQSSSGSPMTCWRDDKSIFGFSLSSRRRLQGNCQRWKFIAGISAVAKDISVGFKT